MSSLKKRMTGLLQRKDSDQEPPTAAYKKLSKNIEAWCQSGASFDALGFLPAIVETSVASPSHAKDAAKVILYKIANPSKAHPAHAFGAASLILILCRHMDGEVFCRQIDDRFVGTVRAALRDTHPDTLAARHALKDNRDIFEAEIYKAVNGLPQRDEDRAAGLRWKDDPNIKKYIDLKHDPDNWRWCPRPAPARQALPDVVTLSERLREANTSANILEQTMNNHGGNIAKLFQDTLFLEFAARCNTAKDSLQGYIDLINTGDQSYDQDTVSEIYRTRARVGEVRDMYEAKQRAHNSYRLQTRSPPTQQPTSFAPPPGQPPRANGAGILAPVQPTTTPASNPAARLDDPFDDSNELQRGAAPIQGLPGASSSRPSLAINTGSHDRNVGTPAQASQTTEDTESAAPRRKYVF